MKMKKKGGFLTFALALALVFSLFPNVSAKAATYSRDDWGAICVLTDGTVTAEGEHYVGDEDCVCGFYNSVSFDSVTVNSASKTIKFTNLSCPSELSYAKSGWTIIFDGNCNTAITIEEGSVTIDLTAGSKLTSSGFWAPSNDIVTLADGVTISPENVDFTAYGTAVTLSKEAEETPEEETTPEETSEEETTDETASKYTIVEGKDQTLAVADGKDLVVKADGDIDDFTGLKIDGTEIDKTFYTVEKGSTIAKIKAAFLETLKEGSHTLTFVYTDGEVSTSFTLKKAAAAVVEAAETTTTSTTQSPKTGDTMNMAIMMFAMLISLGGIVVLRKKVR